MKRVITSFAIDESLLTRMDQAANDAGWSRSQFLRAAVERYLESEPTTDTSSVPVVANAD